MKLIIFTAPSGAGKTTLVKHILGKFDQLAFSVSATTRTMRPHEEHGKDYYFFSLEEWNQKMEDNDFLEWEEVYENQYYGTLKSEIDRLLNLGKYVVFDIEVKGAANIKEVYGDKAVTIFVKPPSPAILFQRLKDRKTESEESLNKRIARASMELEYEPKCDYVILNDDLDLALLETEEVVKHIMG